MARSVILGIRTARLSTLSSGDSLPVPLGRTFLSTTANGKRSTTGILGGAAMGHATASSKRSRSNWMLKAPLIGNNGRWMGPSSVHTAPPRARRKTGTMVQRSIGGFSTKIHLLSDGNGLPLDACLTPGQTHESTQVETVREQVAIPRASGRIRRRPRRLAADRAYDAQRIRHWLRLRGIRPVIPPKRRTGKRERGRPITYNRDHYRRRSTIEQCVGWLKECRAIATRYEKLALNYLGLVKLAFIERYLRLLTRAITTASSSSGLCERRSSDVAV